LTPEFCAEHGIRGIILDADNTLVPRKDYILREDTEAWIRSLQAAGCKLCILSNSGHPKAVAEMVGAHGMHTLCLARKPLRAGYRRALAHLGTALSESAMVGDQLFTDILGGNRMGMLTIMVRPMSTNDFILYRLFGRPVERPLMRRHWLGLQQRSAAGPQSPSR
jgi:HAD superfamily phosphatase (TIGR01668 family)